MIERTLPRSTWNRASIKSSEARIDGNCRRLERLRLLPLAPTCPVPTTPSQAR
jgi:hypothetical protein